MKKIFLIIPALFCVQATYAGAATIMCEDVLAKTPVYSTELPRPGDEVVFLSGIPDATPTTHTILQIVPPSNQYVGPLAIVTTPLPDKVYSVAGRARYFVESLYYTDRILKDGLKPGDTTAVNGWPQFKGKVVAVNPATNKYILVFDQLEKNGQLKTSYIHQSADKPKPVDPKYSYEALKNAPAPKQQTQADDDYLQRIRATAQRAEEWAAEQRQSQYSVGQQLSYAGRTITVTQVLGDGGFVAKGNWLNFPHPMRFDSSGNLVDGSYGYNGF